MNLQTGNLREYSHEDLAAQPIGAWTGQAYRSVVGAIRAQLAVEGLTQADFITTINVLRRMVANLGGNGNLPDDGK